MIKSGSGTKGADGKGGLNIRKHEHMNMHLYRKEIEKSKNKCFLPMLYNVFIISSAGVLFLDKKSVPVTHRHKLGFHDG